MNKKIAVLTFAMFTGSIEMRAMRDGGDNYSDRNDRNDSSSSSSSGCNSYGQTELVLALLNNKYLSSSAQRDSAGFSNTGNSWLDAWRNEPQNGGLTAQQVTAIIERNHDDNWYSGINAISHRNSAWNASEKLGVRPFQLKPKTTLTISEIATRLLSSHPEAQRRKIEEGIKAVEYQVAAQASKAIAVQAQAKTKVEEFEIAKRLVETSPELQAYAVALAAARK